MDNELDKSILQEQNSSISVSVVLYNTPVRDVMSIIGSFNLVQACCKLYLIDNSPRESKAYRNFHAVEYIHAETNIGYGAGHNIAIRKSLAEGYAYHFILNPDIAFKPEVLTGIINYMKDNPDIGLLMPKILYKNGETQYLCKLLPTPFDLFIRRFLPERVTSKRTNRFELRQTGYNKIMEVPFLSGCFMSLRREAIEQCGMFDERFFMYGEDIDFSRRIYEKFRTVYYPYVAVTHGYEAASYKSFKMLVIHTTNVIRYFNKWGWFFDVKRKSINQKVLALLKK